MLQSFLSRRQSFRVKIHNLCVRSHHINALFLKLPSYKILSSPFGHSRSRVPTRKLRELCSLAVISVNIVLLDAHQLHLIFVVPSFMLYSSAISPTRCNNCVFILRNDFTLHVSGDNLTHHQEYICCIWPQVSRLT